jgi:hypothetical protein
LLQGLSESGLKRGRVLFGFAGDGWIRAGHKQLSYEVPPACQKRPSRN